MKNFLWWVKEVLFWTVMLLMLPFVLLLTWWALKQDDKDEKFIR